MNTSEGWLDVSSYGAQHGCMADNSVLSCNADDQPGACDEVCSSGGAAFVSSVPRFHSTAPGGKPFSERDIDISGARHRVVVAVFSGGGFRAIVAGNG